MVPIYDRQDLWNKYVLISLDKRVEQRMMRIMKIKLTREVFQTKHHMGCEDQLT